MATLADCITGAVQAGRISREEGDELRMLAEEYARMMPDVEPAQARLQADLAAVNAAKGTLALQMRQKALQTLAVRNLTPRVTDHKHGPWAGINSILSRDVTGQARATNVDYRGQHIAGYTYGRFAEGLMEMRFKKLGLVADRQLARDVVRELFGQGTGNSTARMAARQWMDASEYLRTRFNKAGGAIAKRQDWGLPQNHDQARVMRASEQEWTDFIMPKLDRERMVDAVGKPLSDPELRGILSEMYESIRTGGLSSMIPGQTGRGKLANRHQESRHLVFSDPDAWISYQERFGSPDVITAMTDHISSMSREIALLEVMGPNPRLTYQYLRDVAQKADLPRPGIFKGLKRGAAMSYTDSLFNTVNGHINTTHNVVLAEYTQAALNWMTSAKLGSATLSQISDQAFMRRTALWNGLAPWKTAQRQLTMLNPMNKADQIAAVKMGLGAEAFIARAHAASRFTEVGGTGIAAKASEAVMRASGMNALTNASQKAFGMEFMATLGDGMRRGFNKLEPQFRDALTRYGITADDWNILRSTDPFTFKGARYFAIENLMSRTDIPLKQRNDLAAKVGEMVLTETTFAVPVPDARVRAITTAGAPRGTAMRTVTSSFMQFKSFPLSVITLHAMRGVYQAEGAGRLGYLASLITTTTLMGAVAMTAKDIAAGRNPRPTDTKEFWAAAFVQGGGAGLIGDFLFSEVNRFGKGITQSFIGPGAGLIDDLAILTLGSAQAFVDEGEINLPARALDFMRGYTPGGNLWYTRLVMERAIVDQLQMMADPVSTQRKFRNIQRNRLRDYGQTFFWAPGELEPDEAPQIGDLAPNQ